MARAKKKKQPPRKIITVDPSGELDLGFYPHQIEIFYELAKDNKRIYIPKGRRLGATRGAAIFCIDQMIQGKSILWVDTVQTNLVTYYEKYFVPELLKIKPEFWKWRQQQKDIHLCKGFIHMRSAEKPENIEGFGYDIIILNEAGIILKGLKGRNLWQHSILPMTLDNPDSKVLFLGVPKGKRAKKDEARFGHEYSLYYELCLKGGLEGDRLPGHITKTYTSYDNKNLKKEQIKELEDEVPRVSRRQEIHGEFLDVTDSNVFQEDWFPVVYELPPYPQWIRKIISLDTAFKKGAENDNSAGIVVLETTVGYFILDMFNKKLTFPELVKFSREFFDKHNTPEINGGSVNLMIIEDKASGTPLIQVFETNTNFPLHKVNPTIDKYSRACGISNFFSELKVFMLFGAWNAEFRNQMTDFNALLDTPDDIVDATSQGFEYFKGVLRPKTPTVTSRKLKGRTKSGILSGYKMNG